MSSRYSALGTAAKAVGVNSVVTCVDSRHAWTGACAVRVAGQALALPVRIKVM